MRSVRLFAAIVGSIIVTASFACAEDFQGTWQGQITQIDDLRYAFTIQKSAPGHWAAKVVLGPDSGIVWRLNSVEVKGPRIKLFQNDLGSTYDGRISPDGESITGIWTIGTTPYQLDLVRATPKTVWKEAPHKTRFVTVDKNVRLEVLDWGGLGRPIILIPGSGSSAHVYGDLASKLVKNYHVYGITTRGTGASDKPLAPEFPLTNVGPNMFEVTPIQGPENPYNADRLGDDTLEVMSALKIARPILVGHSIAGEVLSSIASRHPSRIAGLIYLDAFYEYAYSDGQSYEHLFTPEHPERVNLASEKRLPSNPSSAIHWGMHEYRSIPSPALAIFAAPHKRPPAHMSDPSGLKEYEDNEASIKVRLDRIEPTLPTVRFVRLPGASHWVFQTNEADVLREINTFISGLSSAPSFPSKK